MCQAGKTRSCLIKKSVPNRTQEQTMLFLTTLLCALTLRGAKSFSSRVISSAGPHPRARGEGSRMISRVSPSIPFLGHPSRLTPTRLYNVWSNEQAVQDYRDFLDNKPSTTDWKPDQVNKATTNKPVVHRARVKRRAFANLLRSLTPRPLLTFSLSHSPFLWGSGQTTWNNPPPLQRGKHSYT